MIWIGMMIGSILTFVFIIIAGSVSVYKKERENSRMVNDLIKQQLVNSQNRPVRETDA
jgi:hypothetical protein